MLEGRVTGVELTCCKIKSPEHVFFDSEHALRTVRKRLHMNVCPRESCDLELVTVPLFLTFALSSLDANLLVVLLKRCEIFTRFAEFPFHHAFADVVVNEGTLGVRQIKLVVNAGHNF